MNINELRDILEKKGEKISKATKVKSLIQKQKGLLKKRQSLTEFQEPVLFLTRQSGIMDIYEKATAGKFMFEHTNGKTRFIELRPSDQVTFPYGDKRVRAYVAHENRPFAGWEEPVVDGESVMLGYEKTKATDLKYQQSIERLKNAGKMTWVWIIIGIAVAVTIIAFGYNAWIQPALERKAKAAVEVVGSAAPPIAGMFLLWVKNRFK